MISTQEEKRQENSIKEEDLEISQLVKLETLLKILRIQFLHKNLMSMLFMMQAKLESDILFR